MIATTTGHEFRRRVRNLVINECAAFDTAFVARGETYLTVRAHGETHELRWRPCYHDTAERAIVFVETGDLPPKGTFKPAKVSEDAA